MKVWMRTKGAYRAVDVNDLSANYTANGGANTLSSLIIDVNKNWNAKSITGINNVTVLGDYISLNGNAALGNGYIAANWGYFKNATILGDLTSDTLTVNDIGSAAAINITAGVGVLIETGFGISMKTGAGFGSYPIDMGTSAGVVVSVLSGSPSSKQTGMIWYDDNAKHFYGQTSVGRVLLG